jgi:hypothetical protein
VAIAAATSDLTPTIAGTTNEPGTPTVTVTVGGQTLTTTPGAGGAWTVDAAPLTESSHSVEATVSDAAANPGTASQVLTVDVTVPVVTINGGATRSTSDTSPWTYGTTAEQAGSIVHVTIGGQSLTATVHAGGTWGVSAETLPSATYTVLASITDAALNTGSASQTLTIAPGTPPVTPPAVDSKYLPDAEIRQVKGTYVGAGVFSTADQKVTAQLAGRKKSVGFEVRVTNQGDAAERLQLVGTPKRKTFSVAYLVGGQDVTAAIVDGSYRTETLKAGESVTVTVKVTRLKAAKRGSKRTFEVKAVSAHAQGKADTVSATVKVG